MIFVSQAHTVTVNVFFTDLASVQALTANVIVNAAV
jgi:hypothetical protein